MATIGRLALLTAMVFGIFGMTAGSARAACEVAEVIEMAVDSKLSNAMIREDCDNRVSDAGKCTLSTVIRYAKQNLDEADILEKCAGTEDNKSAPRPPQFATRCDTPFGSCPIVMNPGPVGYPCFCQFWNGAANGVGR